MTLTPGLSQGQGPPRPGRLKPRLQIGSSSGSSRHHAPALRRFDPFNSDEAGETLIERYDHVESQPLGEHKVITVSEAQSGVVAPATEHRRHHRLARHRNTRESEKWKYGSCDFASWYAVGFLQGEHRFEHDRFADSDRAFTRFDLFEQSRRRG